MIEQDTVKLLRECDAGIQMGVSAIDDVIDNVSDSNFRQLLADCRQQHTTLQNEVQELLRRYRDEGKKPNPVITGMSKIKTNLKLCAAEQDNAAADLITDGCNMGVKSLNRYLNQYKAADEVSKDITKRLIHLEEQLSADLRKYL